MRDTDGVVMRAAVLHQQDFASLPRFSEPGALPPERQSNSARGKHTSERTAHARIEPSILRIGSRWRDACDSIALADLTRRIWRVENHTIGADAERNETANELLGIETANDVIRVMSDRRTTSHRVDNADAAICPTIHKSADRRHFKRPRARHGPSGTNGTLHSRAHTRHTVVEPPPNWRQRGAVAVWLPFGARGISRRALSSRGGAVFARREKGLRRRRVRRSIGAVVGSIPTAGSPFRPYFTS